MSAVKTESGKVHVELGVHVKQMRARPLIGRVRTPQGQLRRALHLITGPVAGETRAIPNFLERTYYTRFCFLYITTSTRIGDADQHLSIKQQSRQSQSPATHRRRSAYAIQLCHAGLKSLEIPSPIAYHMPSHQASLACPAAAISHRLTKICSR